MHFWYTIVIANDFTTFIRLTNFNFTPMPYFNLNDSVNLLSKVTPRRAINALKVWSSYRLSRVLGRPIQWGYPIS
ncbi:MAG: hypothetical protein M3040_12475, partial [Bacteroidota bacterium]|nr:hypothetical protein [Bacteroidota bacterium]